jgi:hypothetical protein
MSTYTVSSNVVICCNYHGGIMIHDDIAWGCAMDIQPTNVCWAWELRIKTNRVVRVIYDVE